MAQTNPIVTPVAAGPEETVEDIRAARAKALRSMRGIIKEPFDWRAEKAWIYEGLQDASAMVVSSALVPLSPAS